MGDPGQKCTISTFDKGERNTRKVPVMVMEAGDISFAQSKFGNETAEHTVIEKPLMLPASIPKK
jgi:hypothetical protein